MPRIPPISTSHTLRVGGHTLVARALNPGAPGDPTILLHGITASVTAWSHEQARPWLETGPCYSLSLPGHFPARFPAGLTHRDVSADMVAATIRGGIRALVGDTPVTLVGHSTGGFAALAVAARAPEQVVRVVSISGFARGKWAGALGLNQHMARSGPVGRALLRGTYALCRRNRGICRASLRIYVHDARQFYANPGLDAYIDENRAGYRNLDLDAMAHYFRAMPEIDISAWLGRIRAPVLLITGAEDPIVPASESVRIARLLAHATLRVLPCCGHLPYLEQPAVLEAALRPWLAATAPGLVGAMA